MLLSALLGKAYPALAQALEQEAAVTVNSETPECVIFFSIGNPSVRARVHIATGSSLKEAWATGSQQLAQWASGPSQSFAWLRVDVVSDARKMTWAALQDLLSRTKRNYFRFGLSFTADFSTAILEQELAAHALLYDNKSAVAIPNAVNLQHYSAQRFGTVLKWPTASQTSIWRFKTRAVFTDGNDVHPIEHEGRNRGYRVVQSWDSNYVHDIIAASTAYLARQVRDTGQYDYGWFPCFDRAIPTYNALRHASSTYALLEGWELTRNADQEIAAKQALAFLTGTLIKRVALPDGGCAAFLVDTGNEIKLGGNAVSVLALSKYTELTGDTRYLALAEQLAVGILHMQNPASGAFTHVLNYPDLSVKALHRIIYYDGEAAFGLIRLYSLTKDDRWLQAVVQAFEHFIQARHWEAHDHWLSYCVNELTIYRPDIRYYEFGLNNVRDHLDFVLNRITTFPTLLELMMAAQKMIVRIQGTPEAKHLLDGFDLEKFYAALEARARYLLSGFFWPELAMFFKNPRRILNGFFIRHHSFRVRIDDVEHYLSGYVAYWKYLVGVSAVPCLANKAEPVALSGFNSSALARSNLPAVAGSHLSAFARSSQSGLALPDWPTIAPADASAALTTNAVSQSGDETSRDGKETYALTAGAVASACAGKWVVAPAPDWHASGVCVASPFFQPGHLLIARGRSSQKGLPPPAVKALASRGAAGIICEDAHEFEGTGVPILQVANVTRAVLHIGRHARKCFAGRTVGVTGSAGKTTTVAMAAHVLRAYGSVGATMGSANLPVGVAWNMASMPQNAFCWVAELAIGQMATNTDLACPDVAVVTNVAPAHLSFHGTTQTIASKKARIFDGMPAHGVAVVFRDILHFDVFFDAARRRNLKMLTYGTHADADLQLLGLRDGQVQVKYAGEVSAFPLTVRGEHMAMNALAVLCISIALGLPWKAALPRFSTFEPVAGRGAMRRVTAFGRQLTLIDDAYNANPLSMSAALEAMGDSPFPPSQRVLVLGDMLELGDAGPRYHEDLGPSLVRCRPDRVLFCGDLMKHLWVRLASDVEAGTLQGEWFADADALRSSLPKWIKDGDVVLVKGSHSTGLHRLVSELTQ